MRHVLPLLLCALIVAGCGTGRRTRVEKLPPPTHSISRPAELPAEMKIPLQSHGKHLFVRAGVDGKDVGMFLLDTGAAIDAVGMGLAGRLKLPEAGSGSATGIAGTEKFHFRRIEQLSIGRLELEARRLAAINLTRFNTGMGMSVNGIIGFSSLKKVPFTIDYQDALLTIYQPGQFTPPGNATREPLRITRGLPLILADLGRNRRVWLIVDTGADAEITLPAHLMEKWPDIVSVPMGGAGQSKGIGGHAGHVSTWLRRVTLLGVELDHVPVNFEKHPGDAQGRKPNVGRIGHRLLENFRLTFDPGGGAIWAQFRPALQSQADAAPLPFQQAAMTITTEPVGPAQSAVEPRPLNVIFN